MKRFTRHYMPITNFRQCELQTTLHVTQYLWRRKPNKGGPKLKILRDTLGDRSNSANDRFILHKQSSLHFKIDPADFYRSDIVLQNVKLRYLNSARCSCAMSFNTLAAMQPHGDDALTILAVPCNPMGCKITMCRIFAIFGILWIQVL